MSNRSIDAAHENWRTHPVIVASIAAVAGFGVCFTYVVPIHIQSLKNEMAANAESVAKAKATEEKANSLERQLKDALGRIRALERPNLFSLGNPYPVGLGLVKIGQSVDDLEKAYPGAKIKKESRYWTLQGFHSVFTHVTYYFEDGSPDRKIKFISFVPLSGVGHEDNFLNNKLVEILGPPTDVPEPNFPSWQLSDAKVAIYFDPRVVPSYTIMREDYTPNWWPRKPTPPGPQTTGAIPPSKRR